VNSFVALTQESVGNACKVYDLDPNRFVVLGNGFNRDVFNPSHEIHPRCFGEQSTSLGTTPLVLFVGKYSEWKGIDYLIRAMRYVRDRSRIKPVLWILGSGPDHSRKSLVDLIRAEGLGDDVRLWGQVRQVDVAAAMNLAHVLVMPSFQEPFGLVWLEAMACGTRLVTTNQGGPMEFVPTAARERGYATLIRGLSRLLPTLEEKEQYTKDLAAAIEWHIQQPLSRSVRSQIASMVQHLTWEHYADRLFDVYEHVL
jgi:glycosyltransferase involved in cell wall biosynthesis